MKIRFLLLALIVLIPLTIFTLDSRAQIYQQPETECISGQGELIFENAALSMMAFQLTQPYQFDQRLHVVASRIYSTQNMTENIFLFTSYREPGIISIFGETANGQHTSGKVPISWIACQTDYTAKDISSAENQYLPILENE